MTALTFLAVPTGTVDLVTRIVYFFDVPAECPSYFEYVLQVGRTVFVRRRAYGRENDFDVVEAGGQVRGEMEPARFDVPFYQVVQSRFIDRDFTV